MPLGLDKKDWIVVTIGALVMGAGFILVGITFLPKGGEQELSQEEKERLENEKQKREAEEKAEKDELEKLKIESYNLQDLVEAKQAFKMGRYAEAERLFEVLRAKEKFKNNAEVWFNYAESKRLNEAVDYNWRLHDSLGIYDRIKDKFSNLSDPTPEDMRYLERAYLEIAKINLKLGRVDAAKKALDQHKIMFLQGDKKGPSDMESKLAYSELHYLRSKRRKLPKEEALKSLGIALEMANAVINAEPPPRGTVLLAANLLVSEIKKRNSDLERNPVDQSSITSLVTLERAVEKKVSIYDIDIPPPPGISQGRWEDLREALFNNDLKKASEISLSIVDPEIIKEDKTYKLRRLRVTELKVAVARKLALASDSENFQKPSYTITDESQRLIKADEEAEKEKEKKIRENKIKKNKEKVYEQEK